MKSSIQSRVVALVGAGVFVAVGLLSLVSRSTLLVLGGGGVAPPDAAGPRRRGVRPRVRGPRTNPGGRAPNPDDRLVCLMPFRAVEGQPGGAAGLLLDPADRRFVDLVKPPSSPT